MNIIFSTIFCLLMLCADACKIHLKVRSATKNHFQIEVLLPSLGVKTQRALFKEDGAEKKVHIEGENCSGKHWTFRTFKQNSNDEWVKAHEHTGRFDGHGEVEIKVGNDYLPRVASRSGVYCSETIICG
ncbi:hypothetical protein M3Y97_00350400 [Aphelenchoides bicaudatus]|nr:hypothetical protein M3Y97_00350400 [Aphelenchoides bicaudatus]